LRNEPVEELIAGEGGESSSGQERMSRRGKQHRGGMKPQERKVRETENMLSKEDRKMCSEKLALPRKRISNDDR
jgi:hypothetical protein